MPIFIEALNFSLSVTGPIFILLLLGFVLKHTSLITEDFVSTGSELVFKVALPSLMYISVRNADSSHAENLSLVLYGLASTLLIFIILEAFASVFVTPVRDRGVLVQGAFRSNLGIIGLAYCVNAYGNECLTAASLYVGLVTILCNVLSVITLSRSLQKNNGYRDLVFRILTNPMIVAITLALILAKLNISLPKTVMKTGQYLADIALPFALLCTGASINFAKLKQEFHSTALASITKLVLVPFIYTLGAIIAGFKGMELGIIVLMGAAPTAAASYIMVRAMGGNDVLAANIMAVTSIGSLVTTTTLILFLRFAGFV